MKQSIQWIAAAVMAASGGLALAGPGCGDCSYMLRTARIEPVREVRYVVQRPMIVGERYVVTSPSSVSWSRPAEPFNTIGNVVSLPFRAVGSSMAWTGRQLSGTGEMISPRPAYVGERITTVTTVKKTFHHKKHHMYKKVSYVRPTLMPVGERFTTVRVYRPTLLPVGERITTVRVIPSRTVLMPVGERFTTVSYIKSRPVLQPVGERTTIIRTSRVISPWSSCGCR